MTRTELITLLVIAAALAALAQFWGLKYWHAALILAAGLYLAIFTPLGPQIHDAVARFLTAFGH